MGRLIGFILVLAILGGIGYFFIANDFAMTTLISQDKTKIAGMLNRASETLSKGKSYDFTITNQTYKDGVTKTPQKYDVKLSKKDGKEIFSATSKLNAGLPTDGKYTYYFDGTDLYTKYVAEDGTKTFTVEPESYESALTKITNGYITYHAVISIYDENNAIKEDDLKNASSQIAFSFSPFYIGAKIVQSNGTGANKVTSENAIDVTGKLKQFIIKLGTNTEYSKTVTTYNSVGGVKAATLSATQKANWIPAPVGP